MSFARFVLVGSFLVFGLIGVGFVVVPHPLAAAVGIELTNVTADNDFRAVYGGVPFAMAIFVGLALRRPDFELPALWLIALTLGCLAGSRVVSWFVAGMPGAITFSLQAAETFGAVLATVAIRRYPDARAD